jgi:hypothetical protein
MAFSAVKIRRLGRAKGANLAALPSVSRPEGAIVALAEQRRFETTRCGPPQQLLKKVLMRAAGSGNVQVVQALLAAGADPSQSGELLRLPHEEAEHHGFSDVADLLRTALHAKRQ